MRCARRHSYDIARSGYLNLLQPQDKHSAAAGDSTDAVAARARLLAQDIGRQILTSIAHRAAALDLPADAAVADLGSGTGDALAILATRREMVGIGVDLSTAAAEYAARRFPALTWVVANADRRLPFLDQSIDLVISIHGRRNPEECARVLTPNGFLLIAVPAPDDLAQLRVVLLGQSVERNRLAAVVEEHKEHFTVVERFTAREQRRVDAIVLRDLLRSTYRGARTSTAHRLEGLDSLDLTLASDIAVLARRRRQQSMRHRSSGRRGSNHARGGINTREL
jgi:23S rRNA (guanine745-N1)-methyltransferase